MWAYSCHFDIRQHISMCPALTIKLIIPNVQLPSQSAHLCMIIFDSCVIPALIARFMGPTWGPPWSSRPQMGPMNLALWEETPTNIAVPSYARHGVSNHQHLTECLQLVQANKNMALKICGSFRCLTTAIVLFQAWEIFYCATTLKYNTANGMRNTPVPRY